MLRKKNVFRAQDFVKSRILYLMILLVFSSLFAIDSEVKHDIINETLGASKIYIALSSEWNNKVLLLAHGLRHKDTPLSAEFDPESEFYSGLLDQGWIIGSTSYRRNGVIIRDAVKDIELLQKYIEDKYGKADEIYIQGTSMGGMICTLIAEMEGTPYSGILNIGAALGIKEENEPLVSSYSPLIPILFLSNENEIDSPKNYISQVQDNNIKPVLWIVDRKGHCNVNNAENVLAFNALLEFAHGEQIQDNKHILIDTKFTDSITEFIDEKGYNKVISINESYGNIYTSFSTTDLVQMNILRDEYFVVGFQDKEFEVYYGSTYSDVAVGEWIAFITAEGNLQISRNFANASEELKCKADDIIFIKKK